MLLYLHDINGEVFMFKGLYVFMSFSFLSANLALGSAGSQPVPNYALQSEIDSTTSSDWYLPSSRIAAEPAVGLRLPSEYEPVSAVVMTYSYFYSFIEDLSYEIAQAGAKVLLLGGPASIPGVPSNRYEALNLPYNTVWSRDFGPVAIDELTGQLAIVDTIYRHYAYRKSDDKVPSNIAKYLGVTSYDAPIILDGGNLMVDSRGHLYMTDRTYEWNSHMTRDEVDDYLKNYFGVEEVHVIPYARSGGQPADGTGHIDMFAKIVDDCKVIVAQSSQDLYAATLENAAQYFANTTCAPGETWQVYRVKGWSQNGVWYTYTNALLVNNTAIIPSYASDDPSAALAAYRHALPSYRLVTVNSDDPIRYAGAIHCTTREIPAL